MSEFRIHVKASSEYDVVIGEGLTGRAGSLVREAVPKAEKILLVSETNVAKLFLICGA